MSKDLLIDKYGRFYEIPKYCSELGHDIHVVCLSYWKKNEIKYKNESSEFKCESHRLGFNPAYGLIKHYLKLCEIVKENKPDIIVGASDCFHVILASMLAKKSNTPYVIDLYDNFESYAASKIPGVKKLFSSAVKNADAVVVVSNNLKTYVAKSYLPKGPVKVISNAINSDLFSIQDKIKARESLGLPGNGIFIGTAGAITSHRGIDILFDVFEQLQNHYGNIYLVLAGPIDSHLNIKSSSRIHYLGNLSHEKIPELLNTLDVGVICNKDDEFGKYCFPQKAYEMLACGLSVVAADTGGMSDLFSVYPACLYKPGDRNSLFSAIRTQIDTQEHVKLDIPCWSDQAHQFEQYIKPTVRNN